MEKKPVVQYTSENLQGLYAALFENAIKIQPIYDALPEDNLYHVVDVWYGLSVHFHKLYGSPVRDFPDMSRKRLTMQDTVKHAERCLHEIQLYKYRQHNNTRRDKKVVADAAQTDTTGKTKTTSKAKA